MRIVLNLIGYQPGCGGVETYIINLLASLQKIDRENRYLVICDEPAASSLPLSAENFQLRTVAYQRNSLRGLLRGALLKIGAQDILTRAFTGVEADVVHHPLTILNPPGLQIPSVLTFHDMQHEFFPGFFSSHELRQRARTYRSSVQEAHAVIALTSHSKACLIDKYHVRPEKIHIVHSGCGHEFITRDPDLLADTISSYKLERPFIYYPASTWPHKNHIRLLEAIRLLLNRKLFDGELLLTGASMNGHRDVVDAIRDLKLTDNVRWLGHLPQQVIPHLYNLARLMVFPSLYEGFGLPVVEAMASGCPVVCSQQGALPDVGGAAVEYCNPLLVEDIADKMALVWSNDAVRERCRRNGLEQAGLFRWENTARNTIEVYRSAVAAT